MKKTVALLLLLCMILAVPGSFAESAVPEYNAPAQEIPDNEAMAFLRKMGIGWNLGNTFDANNCTWLRNHMEYEKGWTGYYTTRELIQSVADAGFGFIRIPVSWHDHVDKDFNISKDWMDRVQEVVDWALDSGLIVIINTHHDNDVKWYYPDSAHFDQSVKFLTAVWTQMAERFRDYDDRVILEALNEPRLVGTPNEWNFQAGSAACTDAADVINRFNQIFVDTVRATGGNNATRYLCVTGYAASPANLAPGRFVLPSDSADNRIIVFAHAYTPYDFALNTKGGTTFSRNNQAQRNDIIGNISILYRNFISQGIPAIMDECGCLDKNNLNDRLEWCMTYVSIATSYGVPVAWWDNGSFHGNGENFGIFSRATGKAEFPEIIEMLVSRSLTETVPAE